MYNTYDIVYSLGDSCGCPSFLDDAGLRSFAGPFDWVGNVNGLYESFAFMMNGFADFLNFEDFKVRTAPKPVDPRYHAYDNARTDFIFIHDFPKEIPMTESFADVKKKYERRIERFYKTIRDKKRVLLVWCSYTFNHNTSDEDVIRLCGEFCNKMNKTIDFLIIEHTEGLYQPLKRQIADNIARYNLHALAKNPDGADAWLGNQELLHPIFAAYKLRVPWHIKILKPLIEAAAVVAITKKGRRALRNRLFGMLGIK